MAVVFAHEMVQIGLIEELIPINYVEAISKSNKCPRRDNCEKHTVFCKEAFLAINSFESFILSQFSHIHINPKEKYE